MSDTSYAPAGNKRAAVRKAPATAMEAPTQPMQEPEVHESVVDPIGKRIEEMRALRKERKPTDIGGYNQKLSVPANLKDPRLEYRWVNDKSARHYEMKQKGWDYATNDILAKDERNSGTGTRIERISDERTTQKPEKTFLMVKPKEFYDEDKAAEAAKIKANESAIQRGEVRNEQGGSEPGTYIPAGGMKIEHGR